MLRTVRKLYDTLWRRNLDGILLDVPNGGGPKYVSSAQVDNLELRHQEALLVRGEYILAFDMLESNSLLSGGGVVCIRQPGLGACRR